MIFAGIELISPPEGNLLLEKKVLIFEKYAYCKHIGPYNELEDTYRRIHSVINASGEQHVAPVLEIYGHWTDDQSKLETEVLINLK